MTDDELRRLVRDAVARHLAGANTADPRAAVVALPTPDALRPAAGCASHASHHQYVFLNNASTACVIEPTVSCDHCGYCKSHGH